MVGDDATLVLNEAIDYPKTDRIVRINVWSVPESDAYPGGIKYRLHYGTTDGDTILRYDNAHPRTKDHERHTTDGVDDSYEFPGDYKAVIKRFRKEVEEYEHST